MLHFVEYVCLLQAMNTSLCWYFIVAFFDGMLYVCSDNGGRKFSIWPEWSEAEIASEKFDLGGGKGKDKGKASQSLTVLTIHISIHKNTHM